MPVHWNEIGRGLELLSAGQEVGHVGLSGPVQFDVAGRTPVATTKWWTIDDAGCTDTIAVSNCR